MKCQSCAGGGSLLIPCFGKGFDPSKLASKLQIYLALAEAIVEQDYKDHRRLHVVLEVGCEECGGSGLSIHVTRAKMMKPVATLEESTLTVGSGVQEAEEVYA